MSTQQRRGLGRGLGSLIPTGPVPGQATGGDQGAPTDWIGRLPTPPATSEPVPGRHVDAGSPEQPDGEDQYAEAPATGRSEPEQEPGQDEALQEVPGAFVWIGNGPGEGGCELHNPAYDFNDAILPVASGFLAEVAKRALAGD